MKKFVSSLLILVVLLAALPISAAFAGETVSFPLIAGQNIEVGTVTVSDDGNDLTVAFEVTADGWVIVNAHLYAGKKAPKNGAPGQFPFHSGVLHDTTFTFTIPLADLDASSSDELFIAAHAVVNNENNIIGYDETNIIGWETVGYDCPTLEEIAAALPDLPTSVTVEYSNSLFTFTINEGPLAGTYTGYCIDNGHYIWPAGYGGPNGDYTMNVYSSYEPLPDSITTAYDQFGQKSVNPNIDKEENLDLVNWLINNRDGYTDAEVQDAIWTLVDDEPGACNTNCQTLVAAAYANGEGFVPGDGDQLAIILQPVDPLDNTNGQVTIGQVTIGQVTFAMLGLECVPIEEPIYAPIFQSETGWASAVGDGVVNFRQGWGSYFVYDLGIAE